MCFVITYTVLYYRRCIILLQYHVAELYNCLENLVSHTISYSLSLSLSLSYLLSLYLSICHRLLLFCTLKNSQSAIFLFASLSFLLFPFSPFSNPSFFIHVLFFISIPLFSLSSSLFFSLLLSASAYRFSKRKACVCFSFHTVFIPTTFIYPQPYDTFIHHTRQKCICHKNIHTHIRARKLHMRKLSYAHVCIHPYIHAPVYSHPYSAYIHIDIRACTQARTHADTHTYTEGPQNMHI